MAKSTKVSLTALIFILLQVFAGFILRILPIDQMTNNMITIWFYVLIYLIPLAVVLIVSKDNVKETLALKNPGVKNVLLAIAVTVLLMPFIAFLSYVSMLFFPNIVSEELVFLAQNESLILSVIAIGVLPAVSEELIFRGKLFSGYKKALPVGKAVLISALIFGMAHFNMQQFLYAFVIGMVFAVMVNSAESIFVSVIPHFIINTSQVIMSYFLYGENGRGLDELSETGIERFAEFDLTGFSVILIFAVICLIPAIILLRKMVSMNSKKEEDSPETVLFEEESISAKKEKMFTAPFFVILAIYVLFVLVSANMPETL